MKRIEIEIVRSSEALKAAVATWHRAEKGKPVTPRISFGSIKDLFAAITEKRLELLRYVDEQQNYFLLHAFTLEYSKAGKTGKKQE